MARRDHYVHKGDPDAYVDHPAAAGGHSAAFYSGPGASIHSRTGTGSGYNLMVAGRCVGKTSFLRLLLDTSDISPTSSNADVDDVARFMQNAASRTRHVQSATIEVFADGGNGNERQPLALTVIDTPSLDFSDSLALDRSVSEILHLVEDRFAESIDDEQKARNGDHHIHICLYFLDPDSIVPLSIDSSPSTSLAPGCPTADTPSLPAVEIRIIRQLSARVNVLPVIARADTVTTERLAAIKLAIRRDLADAGIGFGIFDVEHPSDSPSNMKARFTEGVDADGRSKASSKSSSGTLFSGPMSSSSSTVTSPPTSPTVATVPKLPHAIISPDVYGCNDGVARTPPLTPQELLYRYSPSTSQRCRLAELSHGRFTRSYRWGSINILDPAHCDFVYLRNALFQHLQPLKAYTRDYLFERFRVDVHHQRILHHRESPSPALALPQMHHPPPRPQQLPPISTVGVDLDHSRPLLSPESSSLSSSTLPSLLAAAHVGRLAPPPTLSLHFGNTLNKSESRNFPPVSLGGSSLPQRPLSPAPRAQTSGSSGVASPYTVAKKAVDTRSRQKNKKITVACNFCRSRKLKCDGGRPACGQCIKRSNPCDYSTQGKRRGNRGHREEDVSDAEAESSEDRSFEQDERDRSSVVDSSDRQPSHHHTPINEVSSLMSRPGSRRSLNVDMLISDPSSHSPRSLAAAAQEARDRDRDRDHDRETVNGHNGYPIIHMTNGGDTPTGSGAHNDLRGYMYGIEKPLIAPLPFSGARTGSSSGPSPSGSPPVPIRPASDAQAAQRKRGVSGAVKASRPTSNYGPKVVACNFCRARKTKCDGVHPSCGSCVRRSLPCNYVNDHGGRRRATTGSQADGVQMSASHTPGASRPPSPSMLPPQDYEESYPALKRSYNEQEEDQQALKKLRSEHSAGSDVHPPPPYRHQLAA